MPLDLEDAENRYRREPSHQETPDILFERAWARNMLSRTMERLRSDTSGSRDDGRFRKLERFLTGSPAGIHYAEIGDDLGMTEAAVKTAVHRMRKRFGELLRIEVEETLDDPALVDGEIRHLFHVLCDN